MNSLDPKEKDRQRLAEDLRRFKRNGGKTEVLPPFGAPRRAAPTYYGRGRPSKEQKARSADDSIFDSEDD